MTSERIKHFLAIEAVYDVKEWRVLNSMLGKGKSWDSDPENEHTAQQ